MTPKTDNKPPRRRSGGPKFTNETEYEQVIERVADMLIQRVPRAEIALRIGVAKSTITRYVAVIHERWRERVAEKYDARVAGLLAEIDAVRRNAWEQWQRSVEDAKTTIARKVTGGKDGGGDKSEATVRTEGRTGDPRYLEIIRNCNREERIILGVDAPTRVQVEQPEHEWTDDELQSLATEMARRYGATFGAPVRRGTAAASGAGKSKAIAAVKTSKAKKKPAPKRKAARA